MVILLKGKMMTPFRTAFLLTAFLSCSVSANAQGTAVTWSTFTTGFGELTDGNTVAQVIAGQTFAGELEGPGINVGGGFLYNPVVTGLQSSVAISLQQGWNLISNPVTREAGDDSVHYLFPTATYPYGFAFVPGVGYQQQFTMANRVGYWVKFPDVGNAVIFGSLRESDTITVVKGWNLVGSISVAVDTTTIISDPPENRISPWFGYFGALTPVEQILPGYAYWVKAETTGVFILGETVLSQKQSSQESELHDAVRRR